VNTVNALLLYGVYDSRLYTDNTIKYKYYDTECMYVVCGIMYVKL